MRDLKYKVGALSSVIIPLGIQGETGATTIRIDFSEWLEDGTDGYPTISVLTPNGTRYPAATNREDEISEDGSHSVVVWPITDVDTAEFGDGLITMSLYSEGGVLMKSANARTALAPSFLKGDEGAPNQYEYWLDELQERAAQTGQNSVNAMYAAREAVLAAADSESAYQVAKASITLLEAAVVPGAYLDKAMALSSTMSFNVAANEWELVDGLYTVSRENLVALDETVAVFLPDESAVNMADGIRAGCEEGTVYLTTPVVPTGDITGTVILLGHMSIEPSIVPASTSATRAAASATEAAGYAAVAASSMATAETSATAAQTAQAAAEAAAAGISADISDLQSAIQQKIDEPQTEGTSGQVLTTDGNGGRSWTTVEGGGGGSSGIEVKDSTKTGVSLDFSDSAGNVVMRLADGHVQTKNFDSSVGNAVPIEYKISGSDLLLAYGYTSTVDAVVVLNRGRANNLFDFAAFCTKPVGTPLSSLETAGLTTVWSSGTDMHAPFQFLAVNNADGYHDDATDAGFVGGNHTLDQLGTGFETASSKYVHYFADGKPVTSGSGRCSHFEIKWANDVQAYNTVKQGGGGRSCLIEYHDMVFDGVRFNETITLIPSEDIKMELWYGLQAVSFGTTYTNIRFVDGTNRGTYTESGSKSGNNVASGMVQTGTVHALEMTVDTTCDLGKRTYYSGDKGAFVSSDKTYFYIIDSTVNMTANDSYYLKGSYRFYPVVD